MRIRRGSPPWKLTVPWLVTIAAPMLGRLVNRIRPSDQCEPWRFGAGALMRNLARRGLL